MNSATFRFSANLNNFLAPTRRNTPFIHTFNGNPSIKHLIEALGVPHTEVSQIVVNGDEVNFDFQVKNLDQISVFTHIECNKEDQSHSEARFILDNHLGKLATYLRMLGYDTLYRNDYQDKELAQISSLETRILLTRDRRLLMRKQIDFGYCVRADRPRNQLLEVVRRFDLTHQLTPFQRCLRCNELLQPVPKEEILHRLEPLTKLYYDDFHICPGCDQIYWKGSHYERMQKFILQLLQEDIVSNPID